MILLSFPEFLIAVRAMEILAVLFGATCIILTGFWAFLKIEKFRNVMAIGYLITGFLTGKTISNLSSSKLQNLFPKSTCPKGRVP